MTNCLSEVGNLCDERERAVLPAALISLSRTDALGYPKMSKKH